MFWRDSYERVPLALGRDAGADRLLRLADVDQMLGSGLFPPGGVRLVREGVETRTEATDRDAVFRHFGMGGTVILNGLESHWPPLAELCTGLEQELAMRVQANVYLTPRDGQGFAAHYDTHDTFILQVEGCKTWKVYAEPPIPLPLPSQAHKKTPGRETPRHGPLALECELKVGDRLYIPRGFVHEARTSGATSMHVTLGWHPPLWGHVFERAIGALIRSDVRFRRALPREGAAAEARELLAALCSGLDLEGALEAGARGERTGKAPVGGRLLDLEVAEQLSPETRLVRRQGVRLQVEVEPDLTRLRFAGKAIELPAAAEALARHVAERPTFRVAEAPAALGVEGNRSVLRHLVREGALRAVSDPHEERGRDD